MDILGVKIDNLTMADVLDRIGEFMVGDEQHYIVTVNPEFLVQAQKDKKFKKILNQASLAVADGVGLIFASWFLGQPLKQRIAGVDIMEKICCLSVQKKWPIFLLGGEFGADEKTEKNLKKKYPQLEIKVVRNYEKSVFFSDFCLTPSILFVALGAPKQEKWIAENLKKTPQIRVAMGVGGSFDFLSGHVRRAPKILQIIALEWFWRLILQPWRLKRVFKAVVIFPWLVLREKISVTNRDNGDFARKSDLNATEG